MIKDEMKNSQNHLSLINHQLQLGAGNLLSTVSFLFFQKVCLLINI